MKYTKHIVVMASVLLLFSVGSIWYLKMEDSAHEAISRSQAIDQIISSISVMVGHLEENQRTLIGNQAQLHEMQQIALENHRLIISLTKANRDIQDSMDKAQKMLAQRLECIEKLHKPGSKQ